MSAALSRRQTLAGIGIAAVAMTPTALAAASTDRSAWNAAVARYEAATAEVERVGNINMAANDAAEAVCPRNDEYHDRYDMGHGLSRERNFRACHMSLVIERAKGRPPIAEGRQLTAEECKQIIADAERLADEFEAYSARRDAAFAGQDELEARFDKVVDEQAKARAAMIETPAPDGPALQYKIGVLAAWLTDWGSEDADSLNAIHSDATRLLANGRA